MKLAYSFCMMAMLFYAIEACIIDLKLGRLSPKFLLIMYSGGMFILSIFYFYLSGEKIEHPTRQEWIFIGLMILMSFGGAVTHFVALHLAAGAVVLSIFYSLLPVATYLIKVAFTEEKVSVRMLFAWLLGGLALYLISSAPEQK